MDFEDRLESLHKSPSTPVEEIDAAVVTYERLKTAKSMIQSLFGNAEGHPALVAAVFAELSRAAHAGQRVAGEDRPS